MQPLSASHTTVYDLLWRKVSMHLILVPWMGPGLLAGEQALTWTQRLCGRGRLPAYQQTLPPGLHLCATSQFPKLSAITGALSAKHTEKLGGAVPTSGATSVTRGASTYPAQHPSLPRRASHAGSSPQGTAIPRSGAPMHTLWCLLCGRCLWGRTQARRLWTPHTACRCSLSVRQSMLCGRHTGGGRNNA